MLIISNVFPEAYLDLIEKNGGGLITYFNRVKFDKFIKKNTSRKDVI